MCSKGHNMPSAVSNEGKIDGEGKSRTLTSISTSATTWPQGPNNPEHFPRKSDGEQKVENPGSAFGTHKNYWMSKMWGKKVN